MKISKATRWILTIGILAILLTGTGEDGVKGLGAIREAGGITIAESEETAIAFETPRLSIESDYAEIVTPSYKITAEIVNALMDWEGLID